MGNFPAYIRIPTLGFGVTFLYHFCFPIHHNFVEEFAFRLVTSAVLVPYLLSLPVVNDSLGIAYSMIAVCSVCAVCGFAVGSFVLGWKDSVSLTPAEFQRIGGRPDDTIYYKWASYYDWNDWFRQLDVLPSSLDEAQHIAVV